MPYDKRLDQYIAKAQPFAQPIMEHLRELVHQAVPDVQETIKWGMPAFEYKGPLCSMASFKAYIHFMFWKGTLLRDRSKHLSQTESNATDPTTGFLQIRSLDGLPPDKAILDILRQAAKLNDDGIAVPKAPKKDPSELVVPEDLSKALKANKNAAKHFENFSYSKRKEYVEWITSAKTDKTRESRLATAVEWIAEGKSRNWKYQR
jgi:uncharacterized protein YdeI (YjbR/CyaY-like superfamily)